MICLPWHPLREIQSQAKNNLFTACCFSTRQSDLMPQARQQHEWKHENEAVVGSFHLPIHVCCSVYSNNWRYIATYCLIGNCMASLFVNCTTMIMAWWVEPQRHAIICVSVCVCVCYSFIHFSAQLLKTRHWKLQYLHNAVFSLRTDFWFKVLFSR